MSERSLEMTSRRLMDLEDFWRLRSVIEARLSPTGDHVAYTVGSYQEAKNRITVDIWIVNLSGNDVRCLTDGRGSHSAPRWSPDGGKLAFVSRGNNGKDQIFVMSSSGEAVRQVTHLESGAHSPCWSPSGDQICFASVLPIDAQIVSEEVAWFDDHPEADGSVGRMKKQATLLSRFDGRGYVDHRSHLFLIGVAGQDAEPRQITDGDFDDSRPSWSPDGKLIAHCSQRGADTERSLGSNIWTFDVDTGELLRVTREPMGVSGQPSWSPDGKFMAFYARPDIANYGYQDCHVWIVPRVGGDMRDVSAHLDQTCAVSVQHDYIAPSPTSPAWSPDGLSVRFIAADRGDQAIFSVDREGGPVERLTEAGWVVVDVQYATDGHLLAVASTPSQPFDLFTVSANDGSLQRLTQTNGWVEDVQLAPMEPMNFVGALDWQIGGWIFRPPAVAGQYPLILNIHG